MQGKRLIEGHYLDYLVDDMLSDNTNIFSQLKWFIDRISISQSSLSVAMEI